MQIYNAIHIFHWLEKYYKEPEKITEKNQANIAKIQINKN